MRPPSTVSPTVPLSVAYAAPLPEVARGRAAQVPARADPERGDAGDAGQCRERVDPDRGGDGQERRHGRDQRLRQGEADGARQRVDVRRRAGDQVAGAGPLDGRERQREHAPHEVLAQLGEHGSESTKDARRARKVKIVCATRATASTATSCRRGCASSPPRPTGRARPAAAARPVPRSRPRRGGRPSARGRAGAGRPGSAAWARSSLPAAIGSSSLIRPPRASPRRR